MSARLTEPVPNAKRLALVLAVFVAALAAQPTSGHAAGNPCTPPVTNPVACENSKPGNPPSDWDVVGIGDTSIQGFATKMSVNVGQQVSFNTGKPITDRTGNPLIFTPEIRNIEQANEAEGVRFNKFPPDPAAPAGDAMSNDFPFFRLAEMYLIKAEALNESSRPFRPFGLGSIAGALSVMR